VTRAVDVREYNGPRGGEFYFMDLSDGRAVFVSRKPEDERVWLGRPNVPGSFYGQRGGIGNIRNLLDEWRARIALDPKMPEMYAALVALAGRKDRGS
jgi:hypothetical protein